MKYNINEKDSNMVKEMIAKIYIVDAAKSDMDINCYFAELSGFDIEK